METLRLQRGSLAAPVVYGSLCTFGATEWMHSVMSNASQGAGVAQLTNRKADQVPVAVVLGGYGTFGWLICASLAKHPEIRVVVAGRNAGGASTCPALSTAVADEISAGLPRIDALEIAVAPGQQVDARASLESHTLFFGLAVLARLVRGSVIRSLEPYAMPMLRLAKWFEPFGTDSGAMHVTAVSGTIRRTWSIVAQRGDGPQRSPRRPGDRGDSRRPR
jgi:hypothetical protein